MHIRKTPRDQKIKVNYPYAQPVQRIQPRWFGITPPGDIPADVNRMVNARLENQMTQLMPFIRDLPALAHIPAPRVEQAVRNILTGNPGDGSMTMATLQLTISSAIGTVLQPFLDGLNTIIQPMNEIAQAYAQTLGDMIPNIGHVVMGNRPGIQTGSEVVDQKHLWLLDIERMGYGNNYRNVLIDIHKHFPQFDFNHIELHNLWDTHGDLVYRGKTFDIYLVLINNEHAIRIIEGGNHLNIKITDLSQFPTILDMCCFMLGDKSVQLPNDWKVLL